MFLGKWNFTLASDFMKLLAQCIQCSLILSVPQGLYQAKLGTALPVAL